MVAAGGGGVEATPEAPDPVLTTVLDALRLTLLTRRSLGAKRAPSGKHVAKLRPHMAALNPTLARLLALCRLDRRWVRGEGVWLFDETGRWFLDGYAQYGAVALGHNAPGPAAALREALDAREPAMVQPYRAPHAEALADELVALAPAGLAHVVFALTGAETVEAAVKLVRARSRRPLVVAAKGGYHGKTLGTLSLAGSRHAAGFGPLAPGFLQVPWGDSDALAACLREHAGQVAGVVLEPIQGEGGVRLAPAGYLRAARALCTEHGAALVLDEVQTGLGRTGRLFACEHDDVRPDVLCVAKGLSGGLTPLGAMLSTTGWWDAGFGLSHSSTFANNNLSCRVGRAVLRELVERDLAGAAARKGERVQARLQALAKRHPRWILEVRGRGLLNAIELRPPVEADGTFLATLQHHGVYAYAVAGAIARCASLLLCPTLGEHAVLRLAPPLVISDAELDIALAALDGVFAALEREGVKLLLAALGEEPRRAAPVHLDGNGNGHAKPTSPEPPLVLPRPKSKKKVDYAFVAHLTRPEELLLTNPGLTLAPEQLAALCRFVGQFPPVLMVEAPTLRSPTTGATVDGVVIMLPHLPEDLVKAGAREACRRIEDAVTLAADLGARVVGLGGHTTPFSRHGHAVVGRGPRVTTGNALTAGAAVATLEARLARRGLATGDMTFAILGAAGSVAGMCARLLVRAGATRLLLVGNPASGPVALGRVKDALAAPGVQVDVTTDLARLEECQVIVCATASRGGVLDGVPLAAGTIVCDLARPPDTSVHLRARTDLDVFEAGLLHLPDPTATFGPGNLVGLPPGVQLACLCETALLALEGGSGPDHVGRDLPLETVDAMLALAARHGFRPRIASEASGGATVDGAPASRTPALTLVS
jgi:acetylornithine/succinyldiaminopimelate/putrescine aminotransferase/predicted amino acid dehydrogenase